MPFEQTIKKINDNPRILFLIDGIGALLSAFLMGVVLVEFEEIFGIPTSVLYLLATIPIYFAIYDAICYFIKTSTVGKLLMGIAILNILYCCLSIGLALYHHEVIKSIGWIYILIEITIILTLVGIELRAAKRHLRKS